MDHQKQDRYLTGDGTDWIDKFAGTSSKEQFRGAMAFTIGKYMSRMGKKDTTLIEVTKIADYANRWLKYEQRLCGVEIKPGEQIIHSDVFDELAPNIPADL